jgi:hypothetical protein
MRLGFGMESLVPELLWASIADPRSQQFYTILVPSKDDVK